MSGTERWALGVIQNPVRGLVHGGATLLAGGGIAALVMRSPNGFSRMAALLVFGFSLVAVYATSTVYHTFPWSEAWKGRLLRVDHSAIYLLVAGTSTPVLVIVLGGWVRWGVLAALWGIAIAGIVQLAFFPQERAEISIVGATTLGWFSGVLLVPLALRLPLGAVSGYMLGGLLYTFGLVLVLKRRPRLWPRVFSYHEVFHLLVVGGSLAHFFVTWRWVATYGAA